MSFDRIVEALIQAAKVSGEFENLPGQDKKIDLTDYFNMPEDIRVAHVKRTKQPDFKCVGDNSEKSYHFRNIKK